MGEQRTATWKRSAIAVGVLCLLGAVAATFLPASPQGASCGTWVAPEWTAEKTDALVERAMDLTDQSLSDDIADQGYSLAANARLAQRLCDDALGTRRTVTLVLLGAGIVVPAALLFVAGARRRDSDDTAVSV